MDYGKITYVTLIRVEEKLNRLLAALAEDEPQPEPNLTLDGDLSGEERDQTQAL
jgi:hypothetical protein